MKTKFDYHRLIVNCFCEFERGTYGSKLNEAVRVYDRYPDPDFWDWMIINCNFKVPSLEFLLTEDGTKFIQEKYRLKAYSPKKTLTDVRLKGKVGKDKRYPKKITSVLDFIKNGKEK